MKGFPVAGRKSAVSGAGQGKVTGALAQQIDAHILSIKQQIAETHREGGNIDVQLERLWELMEQRKNLRFVMSQ